MRKMPVLMPCHRAASFTSGQNLCCVTATLVLSKYMMLRETIALPSQCRRWQYIIFVQEYRFLFITEPARMKCCLHTARLLPFSSLWSILFSVEFCTSLNRREAPTRDIKLVTYAHTPTSPSQVGSGLLD